MLVYLVHHAEAVGPEVDPQRPLSARGVAQAEALAEKAKRAGVAPASIWHSGKLRARQTAEPFLRACQPFAEFKMVRGLLPDDPPAMMQESLNHEARDIMLVGHMPHIAALLQALTGEPRQFPLHGMVALERDGDKWEERWRA